MNLFVLPLQSRSFSLFDTLFEALFPALAPAPQFLFPRPALAGRHVRLLVIYQKHFKCAWQYTQRAQFRQGVQPANIMRKSAMRTYRPL